MEKIINDIEINDVVGFLTVMYAIAIPVIVLVIDNSAARLKIDRIIISEKILNLTSFIMYSIIMIVCIYVCVFFSIPFFTPNSLFALMGIYTFLFIRIFIKSILWLAPNIVFYKGLSYRDIERLKYLTRKRRFKQNLTNWSLFLRDDNMPSIIGPHMSDYFSRLSEYINKEDKNNVAVLDYGVVISMSMPTFYAFNNISFEDEFLKIIINNINGSDSKKEKMWLFIYQSCISEIRNNLYDELEERKWLGQFEYLVFERKVVKNREKLWMILWFFASGIFRHESDADELYRKLIKGEGEKYKKYYMQLKRFIKNKNSNGLDKAVKLILSEKEETDSGSLELGKNGDLLASSLRKYYRC